MKPFVPEKLPIREVVWEPLVPLISQANRAVARYDGVLYAVPNTQVLLSPLTTQEAVLSSRMEGTRAGLGEVLRYEAGEDAADESEKLDIQEIVNYRRALSLAEKELETKPFSLDLLLRLHAVLLEGVRGHYRGPGQLRTGQNWIGAPNSTIQQARYVPPDPKVVPVALEAWAKYYHSEQPDPLVQLAVVHAQFEIIHPFLDGNGRLGRMLVPLFLHRKGLLSQPVFYISPYLEENRDEYVDRLRDLARPGNWNNWIHFFLGAISEQARRNENRAREMMALYNRLKTRVIALTRSQHAVPMLDLLFQTPVFRSSSLEGQPGMPSKPMIMAMLGKLKDDGILKIIRPGAGQRAQVLALAELVNLCEGREVL